MGTIIPTISPNCMLGGRGSTELDELDDKVKELKTDLDKTEARILSMYDHLDHKFTNMEIIFKNMTALLEEKIGNGETQHSSIHSLIEEKISRLEDKFENRMEIMLLRIQSEK